MHDTCDYICEVVKYGSYVLWILTGKKAVWKAGFLEEVRIPLDLKGKI